MGAFWFRSNLQKLIITLWESSTHFPQAPYLLPFFNSFVKKPALQRKLFSPCPLPSQFMCSATGPLELAHISACGQDAQPCEVSQSIGYWTVSTLDFPAQLPNGLLDFLMELWTGFRISYFVLSCLWHLSQWPVCALVVGWEEEEDMECLVKLDNVQEWPGFGVIAPCFISSSWLAAILHTPGPAPVPAHTTGFFSSP